MRWHGWGPVQRGRRFGRSAGFGANGNDYFVRTNPVYLSNPIMRANVLSLPLPTAAPSAGDGGFGGWGNTHSGFTLQGCTGKGKTVACGPQKLVSGRREVLGTYYGGWGSTAHQRAAHRRGRGRRPWLRERQGRRIPRQARLPRGNGG